ncbi:MAG: hypothetical protein EOM54_11110 [Clostridia bacterium]|nr:hypothetical protein [Clostridia bacterium]
MKKILSLLLAFAMVLSLFIGIDFGLGITAEAASNESSTLEDNNEDVFAALGFDTSTLPAGYDADTTSNPYGRDKTTGNQVFEVLAATSGGTKLYGNNDNTVSPSALGSISTGGASMPTVKLFSGAAGDFDGDGLSGEMAYVGVERQYYGVSTTAPLILYVYDSATNTYSGALKIGDISPYYTLLNNEEQRKSQTRMDSAWQNLLQIATGDYDGDGISEIAVYIAESGKARVDIYKYQMGSDVSENDWLNMDADHWSRVWSYAISSAENAVPNMVSLVSGDFDRDGVDDLGISYGRAVYNVVSTYLELLTHCSTSNYTGLCLEADASKVRILWGGTSGMLQSNSALDLGYDKFGSLIRVSLTYGDADADGTKDLVMAGEPLSDKNGNYQRVVGVYNYDEDAGLVLSVSQLIKVVDTENMEFPTYDSDGNPTGDTTTNTVSKNGYDTKYLSSPAMKCNTAVVTPDRSGYTYIYVDSALCKYYQSSLSLAYELDDDTSCDGGSTEQNIVWAGANSSVYADNNVYNMMKSNNYCEYGAVSGDINGSGNQILITSYMGTSLIYNLGYNAVGVSDPYSIAIRGTYKGYSVLYKGGDSGVTCMNKPTVSGTQWTLSPTTVAVNMPDTDEDTTLIEYSGIHYLTYSDPKVLAVIAAAPYFEDVDIISDYDYAWQNTTSWASTSGSGHSDLVSVDFEIGGYFEGDYTIAGANVAIEASAGFTMEWEHAKTTTYEYTLTFETSQDEDSVAFYCIPTECYVYYVYIPDGNGGYTQTTDIITNSFSPCFQILSLDYYESIQGDYDALPQVAGTAITSTPGDPASYPSSTSGYDVIAAWNQDPAGVSFGNGAITQEISISEEESDTFNFGANVEFKVGAGGEGWSSLIQSGAHVKAGAYFSLNPAGGFSNISLSGTTITGSVTNMPTEFQDYGYYYSWKLFSYAYTFGDGTSVPVVSYVVGDVSEPPELPADFKQDYAKTTSDTNCLTWTYSGSAKDFYIYKYGDYPEGSGLQLIATIGAGDSSHYTLKQDAAGNYYKEFYYNDTNLTAYTQYKYCIQVERSSPVPPLSAPSALLTARTKAADGNPLLSVSESDGANDSALLVYPDKNSYLTVGVTGPAGQYSSNYYTTVLYQWQKMQSGVWTNLDNETSMTLTFAGAGVSSAGVYRCRVNVLTKESATYITAYTDSVSVSHSKRNTHISEIWAHDSTPSGVEIYAKVVNDHPDSATIPSGTVLFTLTSGSTGKTYQYACEVDSNGVANEIIDESLPEGVYSVYAYYSGSYVFKPCEGENIFLSDMSSGYAIDSPVSLTYGDGGSLAFMKLSKSGGVTASDAINAIDIYLYKADTASLTSLAGAVTIANSDTVSMGGNYKYSTEDGDVYFFTATRSGAVTLDGEYVYYDTNSDTGCLADSTETGVYDIAESIPAGGYVVRMETSDGSAWASFTVNQREITLQLPTKVGSEGVGEVYPKVGELAIVSGNFAGCDSVDGVPNSALADETVTIIYTNTAGKTFDNVGVANTCGYYVTSCGVTNLGNYKLSFLDGSVSVLGATHTLLAGARKFAGGDVGSVYIVSPDSRGTREALVYNSADDTYSASVTLSYQAGTRIVMYAVPDSGYEVYDWYINGVAQNSTSTSFACVMIAEDTRIEVQFSVKQSRLVFGTSGDAGGGAITCSDSSLTSGSIVLSNSKFTFTATANDGYHFKEWRYTELGSGTAYDSTDEGADTSTFTFTMPIRSCSLYAVFERDYYTLALSDSSGNEGLTAYYYASSSDAASGEKTWVSGTTASIKGDTEVVVQPATGFLLDNDYAYVSEGSQGEADYDAGTFTFTIREDTTVTCSTKQQDYDVTLRFNVSGQTAQPSEGTIVCTAAQNESTFLYADGAVFQAGGVAGGSSLSVSGSCAPYYDLEGWESSLTSPVSALATADLAGNGLSSWQSLATAVSDGGSVSKGSVYKYTDTASTTYYFTATETGKIMLDDLSSDKVHVIASGDSYSISELGSGVTLTLYLTEKATHTITLGSITDGTYSYSLPVGATHATESGSEVITLHDGDDFPVTATSVSGKTVTYWMVTYTPEGTLLTSKYRATSATYTLEDVGYDYTVTPLFAASIYNTVSWPAIGSSINGITLIPLDCLSSVASGSSFTFKLEGSDNSLALIDKVYANGYEFTAAGNVQEGSTYSYNASTGTYTISNITANQVITLTFNPIGVTVNGTDISAFSGTGWTYDAASQVLTISGSSRIISGTNNVNYAPDFTIVLDSNTGTVTFDNLTLTSGASGPMISAQRTTGVSITATGANTLTGNNGSTTSAILIYTVNNLTLRGAGSLMLNLNRTSNAAVTKAICCSGEFFITGTVDVTVNVPKAAAGANASAQNTTGIWCGKFTMGVQDSLTSVPSLKVYMYGTDGASLDSGYYAVGILSADDVMTVWTGSLLVCAYYGMYAPYHYINNNGGSTEIYSLGGAIYNAQHAYWLVDYNPDNLTDGSGFLACYGESDTDFTAETFGRDEFIQLDGYDFWETFLWNFFGLNEDDVDNPLESAYLRIAPATVSDPGITVTVTDPASGTDSEVTSVGTVALSSGIGGDGIYYYYDNGGVLTEKAESDIHHSDYRDGTVFYAKYNNGKLALKEFVLGLTSVSCEASTYSSPSSSYTEGTMSAQVTGTDTFDVISGYWYHYTNGSKWVYFKASTDGWVDSVIDLTPESITSVTIYTDEITSPDTEDLNYTLSGVDDGLSIVADSASSLTLSGLTAKSLSTDSSCTTFYLSGNNYLAGDVPGKGVLTMAYSSDELNIVSDGTGTLYAINASTDSGSLGIQVVSASTLNLKLTNVKSLSAYGASGGIKATLGYTVNNYDAELSNAYGVYGYGWLAYAGNSSATATVQKGALMGTTSISGLTNSYVRYYCMTSAAGCTNSLVYDQNTAGTSTLSATVYCPSVMGQNHMFIEAESSCLVKLRNSDGAEVELTSGTDYSWVQAADGSAMGTLTLIPTDSGVIKDDMELGDYTIVVNFFDDRPADATYYALAIPFTVKDTHASEGGVLTIAPTSVTLSRGGAHTFAAAFTGTTPKTYEWYLDGVEIENANGINYTMAIADDMEFRGYTLTAKAYEDADGTVLLGTANADITVAPKSTGITISCATETASGDGTYTLYHNSLSSWDFDAVVTLDDGSTSSSVTWSLWGANMRSTAVDRSTGVLAIAANETGSNGILRLTATYNDADGTSRAKTVVIWLSSDALVGYSNAAASNGSITSVYYGAAQNAIPAAGAWIPSGATVTATAVPDAEFTVNHWYVNGVSVMENAAYTVSNDGNTLAFTAANMGKYTITADYINMYNFAITYSAGDNGSLTAAQDGAVFASGTTVLKNTSVVFTAMPDTCYQVRCWYVDDEVYEESAGTTYTGTALTLSDITEAHAVRVEFEGMPVNVTFVAGINTGVSTSSPNGTMAVFDDGEPLSITPSTGGDNSLTYTETVNAMSELNIFANPAAGYQVKCWYIWTGGEYVAVANSAETANYYVAAITGALKVKAEFEPIPEYTVTVSVDSYQNGGGTVMSGADSVSTSGSLDLTVHNHDDLTLLAVPDAGSYPYEWRVANASYTTEGNSITLTDITGDASVSAVFRKVFYDVTLSSGEGGTMTAAYNLAGVDYSGTIADDGSDGIKSGSTVTATIVPEAGYTIDALTVNGAAAAYAVSGSAGSYTYTYTIPSLLGKTDISVTFKACVFHDVTVPAALTGGAAEASFVTDGFSKDTDTTDSKVEILSGGSAILAFTPSADYSVDKAALSAAVSGVLSSEQSGAAYRIFISGDSYCVEITGIDTDLDFSSMSSPFVLQPATVNTHEVNFSKTGNGMMTASYNGTALVSGAKIPEGASVVFTMTPNAHNGLAVLTNGADNVLGDAASSGSAYTYTAEVGGAMTVGATFEVSEYYVTISVLGTGGGTVTATANGISITSGGYLPAGSNVSITATADTVSSFNCMSVNNVDVTGSQYTVSGLGANISIAAVFDAVYKPVTYNVPANGTLKVTDSAGNPISNGAGVAINTILVITATPDNHYALSTLTAGGTPVAGNTYIVDASKTNNIVASFTVSEVPVTWTNPEGGSIRAYDKAGADITSGSYVTVGSEILIRGVERSSNYRLSALTMNGAGITSGNLYKVPASAVTLTAAFTYVGDAPTGGTTVIISDDPGGVPGSAAGSEEINVHTTDGALTALGSVTTTDNGVAVDINGDSFAEMAGHAQSRSAGIIIGTDLASVTFDTTAVGYINELAGSGDVILEINQISAATLSAANQQIIGSHPVYNFTLTAGSVLVNSFGGGKAAVSVPYTLKVGETPETVVAYYIDNTGALQIIRGAYHADTGTLKFVAEHFSSYAIGSNPVSFSDVSEDIWYHTAVTFIAARKITTGIGAGLFAPDKQISRGEFLVMLMRAYGIEPEADPTDNFSDAGNTYYTNYLAAAKHLGITNGIGNNQFMPDAGISRQDMFTLLYRALDVLDELPESNGTADLTAFPDSGLIADYAQEAFEAFIAAGVVSGSGGMLNPKGQSTRAEMAQILYNLLSK